MEVEYDYISGYKVIRTKRGVEGGYIYETFVQGSNLEAGISSAPISLSMCFVPIALERLTLDDTARTRSIEGQAERFGCAGEAAEGSS